MLFSGSFITRASGSVGDVVASHNRGGQYLRERVIPTDPATALQTAVRDAMGVVSARYSLVLTAAEIDAWALYAWNSPTFNALGAVIILSPQQQYVRTNVLRELLGLSLIDTAPVEFTFPPLPIITSFTIVNPSSAVLTVNFDVAPTGGRYVVFMGEPQIPATTWFRGPWRLAGSTTTATFTDTSVPFSIGVGQRVWIYARKMDDDGRTTGRTQSGPELVTGA